MVTRKRCSLCNHEQRDEFEEDLENMSLSPDDLDKRMEWTSGTSSRHQRNHMSGYEKSSNPRCKICTSEIRSELEMEIYSGDMSSETAAKISICSVDQVIRHMKYHMQPLVQKSAANLIAQREIDEIETLSENIDRLNVKIDELFNQDDLSPKYLDSLTKLAKEIRESLRYLLEFKGKLVHKRQDTVIITQMNIVKEVLAQNHPQVWLDVRKQMEERMQ
tara:strand:- start:29869 stop:30525 length:657 start_codon:yes stop_codon:yes gene_type:complete